MLGAAVLLAVAMAAQVAVGTPTPITARSAYAVKETHFVPQRWKRLDRAPKDQVVHLKIGVKQSQFGELEKHLYEVSDPGHERYGKHLSFEEVNELIKPTDEALTLVHEWLMSNGIGLFNYSPAKDWVNVKVDIETAERLLETEYYTYEYEDGTQAARTTKWSLPKHLHEHIDTIQPTTSFMRGHKDDATYKVFDSVWIPDNYSPPTDAAIAKVCNISGTTPDCFKTLYGTLGYKQKVPGINQIGFNNFLGEIPIRPDTAKFLSIYDPEAVSGADKFKFVSINGGPQQDGPLTAAEATAGISREANLDVQTIIGMTYPMPVTAYTTAGVPPQIGDAGAGPVPGNEPYLEWINYVLGTPFPPQVISTSYGDDEQTVPFEYAKRVCNSFAQLGARGVSLLFSSGDGGAGGIGGDKAETCISNDGKNTFQFIPSFPASCPYVTAVGATQGFQPEVSAYRPTGSIGPDGKARGYYASGSGFSNYFPRPAYQNAVVPAYIKSMDGLHAGLFNTSGRGYPDISAQGLYFKYVWNGTVGSISGTSASCPLTASVISLVNDALISSGRPPLGFLNLFLYYKGYKGFTDVTSGGNGGCGTSGFPVTKGWDAVTGFGTPQFKKIVSLALNPLPFKE